MGELYELADVLADHWPVVSAFAVFLFLAFSVLLKERVKKAVKAEIKIPTNHVTVEECERTRKGFEAVVREQAQTTNAQFAMGNERMLGIETAVREVGKQVTDRVDENLNYVSGRLDTFDTVALSRYEALKEEVREDLSDFGKKLDGSMRRLDDHIRQNGNGGGK